MAEHETLAGMGAIITDGGVAFRVTARELHGLRRTDAVEGDTSLTNNRPARFKRDQSGSICHAQLLPRPARPFAAAGWARSD